MQNQKTPTFESTITSAECTELPFNKPRSPKKSPWWRGMCWPPVWVGHWKQVKTKQNPKHNNSLYQYQSQKYIFIDTPPSYLKHSTTHMQQHCKHSPGNTTRALPCTMMTKRSEGPPLLKMYWPYSYVLNCMQHMTSRISFALNEANTPNEAMVFSFLSFFACSSSDSSSCAAGLRLVSPPHVFINKVPRRALAPRGAAPVVLDRCRFQTKQNTHQAQKSEMYIQKSTPL